MNNNVNVARLYDNKLQTNIKDFDKDTKSMLTKSVKSLLIKVATMNARKKTTRCYCDSRRKR